MRPGGAWVRGNKGSDYIAQLEAAVVAAVEAGKIPTGQYGAVMVDEGHDFAPEWLKLVAQMVHSSTDSLLVLYDDAQNLYGQRAPFNERMRVSASKNDQHRQCTTQF